MAHAPNFQPAPTGAFTPAPTRESGFSSSPRRRRGGGGSSGGGGGSTPTPPEVLQSIASPEDLGQEPTQSIPSSTLGGRAIQSGVSLEVQIARENAIQRTQDASNLKEFVANKKRFDELQKESIGGQTLRDGTSEFFLGRNQSLPEQFSTRATPEDIKVKTTREKVRDFVGNPLGISKKNQDSIAKVLSKENISKFTNPLGLTQDQGKLNLVTGGLIVKQQRIDVSRANQPIRTNIALNLPSPAEIVAFSTFGEASAIVRGESAVKNTKNPKIFEVKTLTTSIDKFGRVPPVLTPTRTFVFDIKGGNLGLGISGSTSKTSKGLESTISKIGGITKGTGTANIIRRTSPIPQKLGNSFVSDVVVQDIAKATTRRGLRIGLPEIEGSIIKEIAKKDQVTGFIIPRGQDDVVRFIGSQKVTPTRVVKKSILKPEGLETTIIRKGRINTPDIVIDIGRGKFPSDTGQTAKFIKKSGGGGGSTGGGGLKTILDQANKPLSEEVIKGVKQALSQNAIKGILDTKKAVRVQEIKRQSVNVLARVKTPAVAQVRAIPVTESNLLATTRIKTPRIKTSGVQFGGTKTNLDVKLGQIPRSALDSSQITKQETKLKTKQRLRTQQAQDNIFKQQFKQTQRLRFNLKLIAPPKQIFKTPPIIIPSIRIPPIIEVPPLIPIINLKKGNKKKKKRGSGIMDDLGLSETFVQRQLLLPLPKELGRLRR